MRKTPFKQSLSKCYYYWTVIKSLIRKNIHAARTEKTSQWSKTDLPPGVAAFFNLLYVQSFGVLLWCLPDRQSVDFGRNATTITLKAISCHQFVEVFLSWSVCIIKSTLHTHLIWRQFRACRICTCMRRKAKHIRSASPCAQEQCAFFSV